MGQELNLLKKHLGEVEEIGCFKAKQIGVQINDANDFIGALQVLSLCLKKIYDNISERLDDLSLDETQNSMVDASISQLIQKCSFMDTALFDNDFKLYMGEKLFEFEIVNPLLILEKSSYENVLAYVEDKREEIATLLVDLATAIALSASLNPYKIENSEQNFKKSLKKEIL